ncbi:hypothetical protein PHLGIDRAFT_20673 [Phlebiopsis gigantea 11061_1 CR5-6]|uniref:Pseudouridine synthase I TruA alpha/beta domain-containing protein n=1 Tax=Phlebiopsis gigantea (strain 11061_1 CR5-6) TaxID=745531 RepID=A0A0C3RPG1_PHLG1|nr:hypothetical protein PHLGIDRAFT_20673 [Phlebiopsis gigantea 11061_1 CR5-6]
MSQADKYGSLSKDDLIARIQQLEETLRGAKPGNARSSRSSVAHLRREQKPFDIAAQPKRKIALKFTYDGQFYNGLEHQTLPTPLPTVEEVLWNALVHTRLVDPDVGFEGVGWEKCGRTDRGVSGAGQVVSFWIRSALKHNTPLSPTLSADNTSQAIVEHQLPTAAAEDDESGLEGDFGALGSWDEPPSNTVKPAITAAHSMDDNDELKYVSTLNAVLPPTLRVVAWSPVSSDFSARFNCRGRHYKYFFSSRGLDIEAMRDGASRLLGEHDFRNLHKLDPAKQLTTFRRRISRAEISSVGPVNGDGTQMHVFDLLGTAFLYNQVRHIMAILFFVGTGLERPEVVTALLNTDPQNPYPPFRPGEVDPPIVTTKPIYPMADALPLVLWDCLYADGDVSWRADHVNPDGSMRPSLTSARNASLQLRAQHERTMIHATLQDHFLKAANPCHPFPPEYLPVHPDGPAIPKGVTFGLPLGGGTQIDSSVYIRLLERKRLDHVEVSNERWRAGKGARRTERKASETGKTERVVSNPP